MRGEDIEGRGACGGKRRERRRGDKGEEEKRGRQEGEGATAANNLIAQ